MRGLPVILTLTLVLLFSFASVGQVSAEITAGKKALIENLVADLDFQNNRKYDISSGTLDVKINDFEFIPNMLPLKDSGINMQFKINAPAKQMSSGIKANLAGETIRGDIYVSRSKIILSSSLIKSIKLFNPNFNEMMLPEYIIIQDKDLTDLWSDQVNTVLLNEQIDMIIFIIEAIPDKYISISNGEVTLRLDQEALSNVMLSLIQKFESEPERFEECYSKYMSSLNQEFLMIDEEIFLEIIEGISQGIFPENAKEINKELKNRGIELEEYLLVQPIGINGVSFYRILITDTIYGSNFDLTIKSIRQGDTIKSDLFLEYGENIDGSEIYVSLNRNEINTKTNLLADYNVKFEIMDYFPIKGDLDINFQSNIEENVKIDLPILTNDNSVDISNILEPQEEERLTVVCNGNPIKFDEKPFIKDGRTMVPIRNLEEAFEFNLNVIGNEVHIINKEKKIILYSGENRYLTNGEEKYFDVPPFIKNDRTMVSIRLIAEEFGYSVWLDGNTVVIEKITEMHVSGVV